MPNEWVARIYRLGEEPPADALTSTPEQRLAAVWVLSRRMWALTGFPEPTYQRSDIPVRILRP